jgi:hypothetical protein
MATKIKVRCPECKKSLKGATDEMIGDIGVCPKCKVEFVIEVKTNEVADIDLWPAKGVWWWVGLIALGSFGQVRQVTSVAVLLLLLPLLATVAICAWWYSQSKKLRRRSTICRLIGYMLFGLGSVSPTSGMVSIVLPMVAKQGSISLAMILIPLASILFGVVLIVVAYFLVFQRS